MKRVRLILIALMLSALLVLAVIVMLPANAEVYTNTNAISDVIESLQPSVIELDNVWVRAQPTSGTCGITTVAVMSNYFGNTDHEADDLIQKYSITKEGATDEEMMAWLEGELPGRPITFESGRTNEEMIRDIHASLRSNSPVAISFAAPNPFNDPYYDAHASVVYGMNLERETITIANAYGYVEEISLVDFLNRMAFAERSKFPLSHRFLWKIYPPDRNAYFLVK